MKTGVSIKNFKQNFCLNRDTHFLPFKQSLSLKHLIYFISFKDALIIEILKPKETY